MWTYLRIAGGVAVIAGLFLREFRWTGSNDSAFQIAAQWNSLEAGLLFFGALAYGAIAAASSFFTRRIVEWLEMTLVIVGIGGVAFLVARFGMETHGGVQLTWAALTLVAGLLMTAVGAHGRYRHSGKE